MRVATYNLFSLLGGVQIDVADSEIIAVGIGPNSEVDVCMIGEFMLGPGRYVPFRRDVKAIRGKRSHLMPDGSDALLPKNQVGGTLQLLLYEKCDALVPPGPRAPLIVSVQGASIPGAAINGTMPILRLPFAGRKQAQFCVKRNPNSEGTDLNIMVRGVRYLTKFQQDRLDQDEYGHPHFVDATPTTLGTTVTAPQAASYYQSKIFYVGGGGDNQEGFDELELYVYHAVGGLIYASGQADGETGL